MICILLCVCTESGSESEEESSEESEKTSSDSGKSSSASEKSSSESESEQKRKKKTKKAPQKKIKPADRYSETTCLWDSESIIRLPCELGVSRCYPFPSLFLFLPWLIRQVCVCERHQSRSQQQMWSVLCCINKLKLPSVHNFSHFFIVFLRSHLLAWYFFEFFSFLNSIVFTSSEIVKNYDSYTCWRSLHRQQGQGRFLVTWFKKKKKKDETHPQNKMWAIRNGCKSLSEKIIRCTLL